jgi:DNA-binding YbaB/EbfC family protein
MDREDLRKAMQQAQEMQVDLLQVQAELAQLEVIGESNDGRVKISMKCEGEFSAVKIDPSLFADGAKAVEVGVLEAIKSASRKSNELAKNRLVEISKKIGL